MLKRLLLGIICAVLLTIVFTALNLYITTRISNELSRHFKEADEGFLSIGRVQTDFIKTLRLSNVDMNLTRYLFLTSMSIKNIISDFNIFKYLGGDPDILNRVRLVGARIYVQNGNFKEGLELLLKDLGEARLTQRIEVQDASMILVQRSGQELLEMKNIWGRLFPGEDDELHFVFTNHDNEFSVDRFLLKGVVDSATGDFDIFVSISNIDFGQIMNNVTGLGSTKALGSVDMKLTRKNGIFNVRIENVRFYAKYILVEGHGIISNEGGNLSIDLDLSFEGLYQEGQLKISGPFKKLLIKGDMWARGSRVNENKTILKGYAVYEGGIRLEEFKIESGLGRIVLNGLVNFASVDMDFLIREKVYNNISLEGRLLCEILYQSQSEEMKNNHSKIYLSRLKLNDSMLSDIFVDFHFNERGLRIYEARGDHVSLNGQIEFEPNHPRYNLMFTCENADLSVMKPLVMKGRGAAHLGGRIDGSLSIEGMFPLLGGKGAFVIENGSIGMISEFKKMIFDFTWNGPILVLQDARIIRENDYFLLKDTIDLTQSDIFSNLKIEHVGESLEWEQWTVNQPQPEIGLDIFGDVGHAGSSASGGEGQGARETLLDLEYEMKDGNDLLFKIKEEESFMGIGKEIKF